MQHPTVSPTDQQAGAAKANGASTVQECDGTRPINWEDLLPLYRAVERCQPGSADEHAAERALSYAIEMLAAGREVRSEYLEANLCRNSRHNEYRAARATRVRQRRLISAAGPKGLGVGWTPADDRPLSAAVARETLGEVQQQLSEDGVQVLGTMILDLSVVDSARQLGLSERTIKRLREQVRASTQRLLAIP